MQLTDDKKKQKAVFLDRDGVITQEPPHYAHRVDQLALVPGAAEAIRLLNDNKFLVVVVTNQAGIARGLYEEKDMHVFNRAMEEELKKEKGARIDATYWCSHHPEALHEKHRCVCDCRKPSPGMILRASRELSIDCESSFLVGDKWSDIEAGTRAGCKTIMVRTGHGQQECAVRENRSANYHVADIFEAVRIVLDQREDINVKRID